MDLYIDVQNFYDTVLSYLNVDQLYHEFPNQTAIPNNLKSEKMQIYPRKMCIQQTTTEIISSLPQIILTDKPTKSDIIAIHLINGIIIINVTYYDPIFNINHQITGNSSVIITIPPVELQSFDLIISNNCTFALEITQPKLTYIQTIQPSITNYLPDSTLLSDDQTNPELSQIFVTYNYVTTQPNSATINQTIIDITIVNSYGEILMQQQMYPRHKVIDWRTPFTGITDELTLNKIDNEEYLPLIHDLLKDKYIITAQLDLLLCSLQISYSHLDGYFDLSQHPISVNYRTDPIPILRLSELLLHTTVIPTYSSTLIQANLLRQLYKYLTDSYYIEEITENVDKDIIELNLN